MSTCLPKGLVQTLGRTRIDFANGSVIEAYPNNPMTIRGPTLHTVYCDEMNYIRDDVDLYDAILFTLGSTGGSFIASSTPGSRDSLFYKICFSPEYNCFSRSHVSYRDALEPNGPLKASVLAQIKVQCEFNPWRFTRECDAEFAEDEETYFPLVLINRCVDGAREYLLFDSDVTGRILYIGVDFGKHHDYSVVAVVQYDPQTGDIALIHLKRFKLETEYASVIGYVKALCTRWQTVRMVYTDITGVGEYITEDMQRSGIPQTEGIMLTLQSKQDILGNMKKLMQDGKFSMPYDSELMAEFNSQRYEMLKTGQTRFTHLEGGHDDRLWAVGLACYAAMKVPPLPVRHPVFASGNFSRPISGNIDARRPNWSL